MSAKSAAVLARTTVIVLNWSRMWLPGRIVNAVVCLRQLHERTRQLNCFRRFQSMFDHRENRTAIYQQASPLGQKRLSGQSETPQRMEGCDLCVK